MVKCFLQDQELLQYFGLSVGYYWSSSLIAITVWVAVGWSIFCVLLQFTH